MNKLFTILTFCFVVVLMSTSLAQTSKYTWLPQDSWNFGFGLMYPRYISSNLTWVEGPQHYGAFASIQRNFSEHIGLRFEANYLNMGAHVGGSKGQYITNKLLGGNLDLLYYLAPSEPISPFMGFGIGGYTHKINGSPTATLNKSISDYQFNFDFGAEWTVAPDWKIKTEVNYYSTASSSFDGLAGTNSGGLLGGAYDSYMTFQVGAVYYFRKGEPSKLNELYTGIEPKIDYDKFESIVKKYATEPTVVDYNRIEDIVKRYAAVGGAMGGQNWALIGVNFDFNKATLRPESYPILYNAAEILLTHPNIRVEIDGYTDNVGPGAANQKLSEKRAETVKNFLISKGVDASRMTTVGYGEANPVVENNTAQNRALNRRIEFKVLSK